MLYLMLSAAEEDDRSAGRWDQDLKGSCAAGTLRDARVPVTCDAIDLEEEEERDDRA